jgi:hypothetical protein
VVAQVPTINRYEQRQRRIRPDDAAAWEQMISADERALFRGEPPRRQAIVSKDPTMPAPYRTSDAVDFYLQPLPDGTWDKLDHRPVDPRCSHVRAGNLDRPVSPTPC